MKTPSFPYSLKPFMEACRDVDGQQLSPSRERLTALEAQAAKIEERIAEQEASRFTFKTELQMAESSLAVAQKRAGDQRKGIEEYLGENMPRWIKTRDAHAAGLEAVLSEIGSRATAADVKDALKDDWTQFYGDFHGLLVKERVGAVIEAVVSEPGDAPGRLSTWLRFRIQSNGKDATLESAAVLEAADRASDTRKVFLSAEAMGTLSRRTRGDHELGLAVRAAYAVDPAPPSIKTPAEAVAVGKAAVDAIRAERSGRAFAAEQEAEAAMSGPEATEIDDDDIGAAFGSPFPSPQEIDAAKAVSEPQDAPKAQAR